MNQPKNLIIDLGGVLLEVDIERMLHNFDSLRDPNAQAVDYSKEGQHPIFSQYETGQISNKEFAVQLRKIYQLNAALNYIVQAWRTILGNVIEGREQAIQELSKRYNIVLLSNTNQLHYNAFIEECRGLFSHFQRLFFSFEMKMRKPDAEIYEAVLDEMNWQASETLFIDDSQTNIAGAKAVGLQTFWMETADDFHRLMQQLS